MCGEKYRKIKSFFRTALLDWKYNNREEEREIISMDIYIAMEYKMS